MTNLKSNATLQRLLDANRRFDLNGRGTTNHCPMALTALAAMGAAPERLERFFAQWERRYALTPEDHTPLAREAWHEAVGKPDLFCAARDCFADWIAQDGIEPVMRDIIARISFAPATGAFHALIRLAYGLEAANNSEIGAGLAALACGRLAIDISLEGRGPAPSVQHGLARLSRSMQGTKIAGTWIAPRLRAVAQMPSFRAVLPGLPQDQDLLAALRAAALALYWQTDDFIALHMVTGVHAARIVLSRLSQEMVQACLAELWPAFCAAYVTIGAPPLQDPRTEPAEEDWPALFALAAASCDDHDIKLAYTCFEENRISPSSLYYAAASRRLAVREVSAAGSVR